MCYKCICNIVPEQVLKELAKRGSEASRETLNDRYRIQEKRDSVLNSLLIMEKIAGNAQRYVYDSENTRHQRNTLVIEENGSDTEDSVANAAYHMSGYVRDYFFDVHNYNSMNGNGMDIISNVHYGMDYNNAYWDGDEMTYGDGDGVKFRSFANAIDVVAHELTHGVTQYLANLEYYSQPGALNEHFSDVFGTIIKIRYNGQDVNSADWLIGDTIVTDSFPGKALRSMKDPGTANEYDQQPAHMDEYYHGQGDNQGVHINSGIPNKAFYLSCQHLSIDDCGTIWFDTLKSLWRKANFSDALEMFLQSAERLSNEGKVAKQAKEVIQKSFDAVGIR